MQKRVLLIAILFFSIFFNNNLFAQSYKSEYLSFYNFVLPESYVPFGYATYSVNINLTNDPINVYVDDVKKGERNRLSYNVFFEEAPLLIVLGGTESRANYNGVGIPSLADFGYINQPKKADDHFILDVTIDNVAYLGETEEHRGAEVPFGYIVHFKYDAIYKIINSVTGHVVMEKTFRIKQKLSENAMGFNGSKSFFKTRPEAVDYVAVNIDKNLVYNEIVKHIHTYMRVRADSWIGVPHYGDSYLFSRVSKADKNPLFLKLNQDVDAMENWTKAKSEPIIDEALLIANSEFIEKNNLSIKDNSLAFTGGINLKNYKNFNNKKRIFTDFILKMDSYSKNLDANDKGQKAALWACYVNIASSFAVVGNHKSSLEYLQKARALDYQERKIREVEDQVVASQTKKNAFVGENGEVKKDVNKTYFKYLNL